MDSISHHNTLKLFIYIYLFTIYKMKNVGATSLQSEDGKTVDVSISLHIEFPTNDIHHN